MHFALAYRSSQRRFAATLALTLAGIALAAGCERQPEERAEPVETEQTPESTRAALVFPKSLRVKEAPVNALLEKAMRLCSEGDYENFRMIWTARQEPISRGEFQKGWAAMKEIRIRALERVALASPIGGQADAGSDAAPEIVYVAYAEMTLDPTLLEQTAHRQSAGTSDAKADARREAVLMIVKELGDWRLAQAPKSMRSWVRKKLAAAPPDTTNP
ncbi:MAG: hypothetical protein ACE5E5_03885 [Phycisphaerae bacterium]